MNYKNIAIEFSVSNRTPAINSAQAQPEKGMRLCATRYG